MSIDSVVHSFSYNLNFLRDQVADVPEADMVAQPNGIRNHPAWVIGHLTYSCQAIGSELGLPSWLTQTWAQQFGTGSVPASTVPADSDDCKANQLAALADAEGRIIDALLRMSDQQLDRPLPDEDFRKLLPTIRHAVTQILVAHTAYHVGQLTLWRNAMNLPVISRPFL
ncbi:MAG: DinB family protein [Fuerstiella sp.]